MGLDKEIFREINPMLGISTRAATDTLTTTQPETEPMD
jgi:hypothetical protein